jgi:hypothetical protein
MTVGHVRAPPSALSAVMHDPTVHLMMSEHAAPAAAYVMATHVFVAVVSHARPGAQSAIETHGAPALASGVQVRALPLGLHASPVAQTCP